VEKTKDPIGETLRKTRESRNVSVPALADIIGIPKDRIYKWEQGLSSPKYDDRKKVEEWLNGNWKNIPPPTLGKEDQLDTVLPLGDLKVTLKDYVELLNENKRKAEEAAMKAEETARELREDKKQLMAFLNENLTALQFNSAATLKQLSKVIRVMRADDGELMDGQDRIQGLEVGTTSTKASTVERAHERAGNKVHKQDDQGTADNSGKQKKA
jgi:transcriptional regulator with XRE-family HTH domain